jgi:hypothetical protein
MVDQSERPGHTSDRPSHRRRAFLQMKAIPEHAIPLAISDVGVPFVLLESLPKFLPQLSLRIIWIARVAASYLDCTFIGSAQVIPPRNPGRDSMRANGTPISSKRFWMLNCDNTAQSLTSGLKRHYQHHEDQSSIARQNPPITTDRP